MRYYPVHLDLLGRRVLVVGGSKVAEGKLHQLLDAGARVSVVSVTLSSELVSLVERGSIEFREGTFDPADLAGVSIVISATDSRKMNELVAEAARDAGIWCNVVDQPELCDFITPALVVRGDLQIGISTSGGSPTLAQRVKREISELIGKEYGELLEIAAAMRAQARQSVLEFDQRRDILREFVESEALELLRAGRRESAEQIAQDILGGTRAGNAGNSN